MYAIIKKSDGVQQMVEYKVLDVQGFFDIVGKFVNGKLVSKVKRYNR